MNLYAANSQWSSRPDDERFENLAEMAAATASYAATARTAKSVINRLEVVATEDNKDVRILGSTGASAKLTHWSFGQLARFANAPADYLRTLPADLAAKNINHGLAKVDTDASLLFHSNGDFVMRAINTTSYDRVWNHEIVDMIQQKLVPTGWVVPPARPARAGQKGTRKATAADVLPNQKEFGLAIKEGDDIAPAGLYASDHDMFAFMVNQIDPAWDGSKFLHRGVFIRSSEIGDGGINMSLFTYDNVCGNHIVWNVGKVVNVSVRHRKAKSLERGMTFERAVGSWEILSQSLPTGDQVSSQIEMAKKKEIAATKEDVLEGLFAFAKKNSLTRLTKTALEGAYDIAEATPRYGSPRSVWGMVNGLTEYSQKTAFSDDRNDMDIQSGRLMEIAF